MEQASRTDVSSEWLLLHDGNRERWILLVSLWSSQGSAPAPDCAPRLRANGDQDQPGYADRAPYALPALIFFWFATFAWGLWYIAHSA
jgi:hypothetical protein